MSGFRAFIAKGNIMDLAVAVIIGAAFAKIVGSLTDDVIMPVVGAIFGGLDFSNYFIVLKPVPAGYHGPMSYAALKAAGVPMLGYGAFLTAAVNFLILAFVIYLMVKYAIRLMPPAEEAAPAGPAEDVVLLREIRDELRRRP
ncbi:MAG: large conductance mechanosensitive channel [Sphingomonadales bacterium]|jgi:large conductance mechanosensitive channel|nr:large conductance mechanosensitive channel [Sphingomonadales bacterium]MEA3049117.1 large conductance mechanosensitive channel [Sphingomonadales bacterium]